MEKFVDRINDSILHIKLSKKGNYKETLLTKYGFLFDEKIRQTPKTDCDVCIDENKIKVTGRVASLNMSVLGKTCDEYADNGYTIEIDVQKDERLFGLGDAAHEAIMKRGKKTKLWTTYNTCNSPIPFLMSTNGWAILVNCTFPHTYDLCATDENKIIISSPKGTVDFYLFFAPSLKELIDLYTQLTGRPILMPKPSYGLVFVNNEEVGARELLENCTSFRKEDIPCDIMGLEPGWMEKHYDCTIDKKWSQERFYIPYWQPQNYSGEWSFFYNLRQKGFGLILWLCCDYDLLWEEENFVPVEEKKQKYTGKEQILDEHLDVKLYADKVTKIGQPWFEHLKKFVDQGAIGFKLDGAFQVCQHPDRLWAGKYTDDEVHNIYPLIYAKQLKNGYAEYTGKRPATYTPHLFAGSQHYASSWAGDTGGLEGILYHILNMSLCGHTNATCDMDVTRPDSMHFGFLLPWTQLLAWRNWHHPWLLGDKTENMIRDYSKLRSSLFPYIYSMSHKAANSGLPLVRPLSLMHEDTDRFDSVHNVYYFGDSLLVGAFDMNLPLPDGKWYDYFTGDVYDGGKTIAYNVPDGKGGALFVKENSVFVTWMPKSHVTENSCDEYKIRIFGHSCASSFDLIDDDGLSYDYLDGKINHIKFDVLPLQNGFKLNIEKINESYKRENPSTLEIIVHDAQAPKKVLENGTEIEFDYCADKKLLSVDLKKSLCEIGQKAVYEFVF